MTWEETILFARGQEAYKNLIENCYLTSDLAWNVSQYGASEEYKEILKIVREYAPQASSLVEFGAGNGIASINFARDGYNVASTEPDESETVGAGAIKKLSEIYKLNNITVAESYAEDILEKNNTFDIVFARQCMHHAKDLDKFTQNAFRILKPGGLFLTVRDHVINSNSNKKEFLEAHPFHKYYGGENAFSLQEYQQTLHRAGFSIRKTLRYYDSVINYFPEKNPTEIITERNKIIKTKFPTLSKTRIGNALLLKLFSLKHGTVDDDENIIGRMYSFISIK